MEFADGPGASPKRSAPTYILGVCPEYLSF